MEGLQKTIGKSNIEMPQECLRLSVATFADYGLAFATTNNGVNLPASQHTHDNFEFLIPKTPMPFVKVENKESFVVENGKIAPFNPGQKHGGERDVSNANFSAIVVQTNLLNDTAYMIYGRPRIFFCNDCYSLDDSIKLLISQFAEEFKNRQPGYELIIKSIITQISVCLIRQLKSNMPDTSGRLYSCEKKNIKKTIDYLWEQDNYNYSLEDMADMANLSIYHFIRVFKEQTGKTPYEYLMDMKIEKARLMLASKSIPITEICFSCGFNSPSHFTTVFKQKAGVTPSQYRKEILDL